MNTELLERIADHIEAVPESWDLSQWAWTADSRDLCDTVGCVAGWAVMLTDPELRYRVATEPFEYENYAWEPQARELLELTADQASALFASGRWWGTQMHRGGYEPLERVNLIEHDAERGHYYVPLDCVPAKAAAEILRGVASGLISLDGVGGDDD